MAANDPISQAELLAATRELTNKVNNLSGHLSVSRDQANRTERQAHRTKILTRLVAMLAALSMAGVVYMAVLVGKINESVETSQNNAVTACENSNQTRAANLELWKFVLLASSQPEEGEPEPTPQEQQLSKDFGIWIEKLYRPRDCSDLSKTYDIPPPPTLGGE